MNTRKMAVMMTSATLLNRGSLRNEKGTTKLYFISCALEHVTVQEQGA
jgi:hypothetical protein